MSTSSVTQKPCWFFDSQKKIAASTSMIAGVATWVLLIAIACLAVAANSRGGGFSGRGFKVLAGMPTGICIPFVVPGGGYLLYAKIKEKAVTKTAKKTGIN